MPLQNEGATGYCSERCLHWDFFGVPALKRDGFLQEMRRNQALTKAPDGWTPPPACPDFDEQFRKEVTEALALLKQECDRLRAHA
jgi:hypothetical protein